MKKTIKFVTISSELVGIIVVAIFLGMFIGEKLGSKNIGAFWGIVIGFSGWVYRIILLTRKKQ